MGNCLVTKLKGVVENDNLVKLGEFRFSLSGQRMVYKIAVLNDTAELTILDNGVVFTQNNTNKFTVDTLGRTATASDDCTISLDDKYRLKLLNAGGNTDFKCDVNDLQYSPLEELNIYSGLSGQIGNITGSFSRMPSALKNLALYSKNVLFDAFPELPVLEKFEVQISEALDINDIVSHYPTLKEIIGFYSNVKGNIETLPARIGITTLRLEQRGNTPHEVTGDIIHLASWRGLTTLRISGTKISGSIADFLDAMYNSGSGRTSGSITITVNSIVTNVSGAAATQTYNFSASGWAMA